MLKIGRSIEAEWQQAKSGECLVLEERRAETRDFGGTPQKLTGSHSLVLGLEESAVPSLGCACMCRYVCVML